MELTKFYISKHKNLLAPKETNELLHVTAQKHYKTKQSQHNVRFSNTKNIMNQTLPTNCYTYQHNTYMKPHETNAMS